MSFQTFKFNRIILVDDDFINNYLNEEIIQEMGIADEIVVFTDGSEALSYLIEEGNLSGCPDDVVLLDINMPGIDGFEFLTQVRQTQSLKDLTVVLLTTSENIRDRDKAKELKVDGYINKPLSRQKIEQCFVQWMDKNIDLAD
jgi:CheY-like chemotaxis protein